MTKIWGFARTLAAVSLVVAAGIPNAHAGIISEAPLWKFIQLTTCNGSSCFGRLPPVPVKERWELQFVSCTADTALDAALRHFSVQVTNAKLTKLLGHHFLAATYQSDRQQAAVHVASQPIVLTAEPGNVVLLTALAVGNVGGAQCSISGVKQTLG